jgi:hypothetical protein
MLSGGISFQIVGISAQRLAWPVTIAISILRFVELQTWSLGENPGEYRDHGA